MIDRSIDPQNDRNASATAPWSGRGSSALRSCPPQRCVLSFAICWLQDALGLAVVHILTHSNRIGSTPRTEQIAFVSEELCIGCGICVKKCPFEAINIINLPKSLEGQQTHRYGPNSFKLHRCGHVLTYIAPDRFESMTSPTHVIDHTCTHAQAADAPPRPGAGPGGAERHGQVHGAQDPRGEAQAQPRAVRNLT